MSFFCEQMTWAGSAYNVRSVVSAEQFDAIMLKYLKKTPSGTKVSDINYEGFFTINNERYLTSLYFDIVHFKVTSKIAFVPVSSYVSASLGGVLSHLDCSNFQVTRAIIEFSNPLFEQAFERDKLLIYTTVLLRDYLIAQTNLVKYCKIRPKFKEAEFE